mmetsp:Transcript_28077/g.61129  ORF Transcript_28077/g.61129 Transcript_28077/m.61129 type:complete len:225 (-) Transcript_28077:332-1006(-)
MASSPPLEPSDPGSTLGSSLRQPAVHAPCDHAKQPEFSQRLPSHLRVSPASRRPVGPGIRAGPPGSAAQPGPLPLSSADHHPRRPNTPPATCRQTLRLVRLLEPLPRKWPKRSANASRDLHFVGQSLATASPPSSWRFSRPPSAEPQRTPHIRGHPAIHMPGDTPWPNPCVGRSRPVPPQQSPFCDPTASAGASDESHAEGSWYCPPTAVAADAPSFLEHMPVV